MKPDVRMLWSKALRSSKYIQGRLFMTALDSRDGFFRHCPLGVLCDLAVQEGILDYEDRMLPLTLRNKRDYYIVRHYGEEKVKLSLPNEVCEWAELSDNPVILHAQKYCRITELNDSGTFTFADFAAVLENGTPVR